MNIIITGASRGIGWELTISLAGSGQHKIVVIARSAEKLQKLKSYCEKNKTLSEIVTLPFDLENGDQLIVTSKQKWYETFTIVGSSGAV